MSIDPKLAQLQLVGVQNDLEPIVGQVQGLVVQVDLVHQPYVQKVADALIQALVTNQEAIDSFGEPPEPPIDPPVHGKNLHALSAALSDKPQVGKPCKLYAVMTNDGDADIASGFPAIGVGFFDKATNTQLGWASTDLGLKAGDELTLDTETAKWHSAAWVPGQAGSITVVAKVDDVNRIGEANEADNVVEVTGTVVAGEVIPPKPGPGPGKRSTGQLPFGLHSPSLHSIGSGAQVDPDIPEGYFAGAGCVYNDGHQNPWGRWTVDAGAPDINVPIITSGEGHVLAYGKAPGHIGDRNWATSFYKFGVPSNPNHMEIDMNLTTDEGYDQRGGDGRTHRGNPWAKTTASGMDTFFGILRRWDIDMAIAGHDILHTLTIVLPQYMLRRLRAGVTNGTGGVWPANGEDGGTPYSGKCFMGGLLYLPASVGLGSLGMSTQLGAAIAKCAQDRGIYVNDTTGPGQLQLNCEANCFNSPAMVAFKNSNDMRKIQSKLRRMLNNTKALQDSTHCAGGGTPRVAAHAPAFA